MDSVIEALDILLHVISAHIRVQLVALIGGASLRIGVSNKEVSTIGVYNGDICGVSNEILVNKEPLNLSHGMMMTLDSICIVDFD